MDEDISIAVIAETPTTFSFSETLDFNTNLVGPQSSLSIPINGQSVVVGLKEKKSPLCDANIVCGLSLLPPKINLF